jgi:hypothetical protein
MNAFPKTKRTVKLWQLLSAIVVVALALSLLPSQRATIVFFLIVEAALVIALLAFLVSDIIKRRKRDEHDA